jgi:dTDP-4-amino-4,6-dideoxygalactose transaminase
MEFMKSNGIQTSIHYPPIHQFMSYRSPHSSNGLPVTEDIGERIVTLPLFADLKREQVDYISKTIKKWDSEIF